jgi:hypothetical protein
MKKNNLIVAFVIIICLPAISFVAWRNIPQQNADELSSVQELQPAQNNISAQSQTHEITPETHEITPMPTPMLEATPEVIFLDSIQHTDFQVGNARNTLIRISDSVFDEQNNAYSNGIMIVTAYSSVLYTVDSRSHHVTGDSDYALAIIDFPLNNQYRTLDGKIALPVKTNLNRSQSDIANTAPVDVLFYGDGELLHSAKHVTTTMPHNFSIDVSGVDMLSIKVVGTLRGVTNSNLQTGGDTRNNTLLTDLVLSK